MLQKITLGLAVVAILLAGVGLFVHSTSSTPTLGAAGESGQNSGGIYSTPTYWGSNPVLSYGTSPYTSPSMTLIDASGSYVGKVSSTYLGSFIGASSTLRIGTGVGHITGCIELGDSATASTTVYITASGATVTATTTKPTICQ